MSIVILFVDDQIYIPSCIGVQLPIKLYTIYQKKYAHGSSSLIFCYDEAVVNLIPTKCVSINYSPEVADTIRTVTLFVPWLHYMMTSSNENIFRVTVHLCGEFTVHRWSPRTKASDAELRCFLWSARK